MHWNPIFDETLIHVLIILRKKRNIKNYSDLIEWEFYLTLLNLDLVYRINDTYIVKIEYGILLRYNCYTYNIVTNDENI